MTERNAKVEEIVNREIAAGLDVVTNEMSIRRAKKTGAVALLVKNMARLSALFRWEHLVLNFVVVLM